MLQAQSLTSAKQGQIPLLYFALVASVILLCLCLSLWQYQRAQQAQLRYQSYIQQSEQASRVLTAHPDMFQSVTLSGHIVRLYLLDNRILNGVVGWHVLADVETSIGPVLVNLGWQSKQATVPDLESFPKPLELTGVVIEPEIGLMLASAMADPAWPGIIQQIDIGLLNEHQPRQLAPFVVNASDRLRGLIPFTPKPENKYPMHIGYAVQWLLIAIACLIGATVFYQQEKRHAHK